MWPSICRTRATPFDFRIIFHSVANFVLNFRNCSCQITVNVEEGARQAQCSASLEGRDLAPGDLVRIGKNFITTIDINR